MTTSRRHRAADWRRSTTSAWRAGRATSSRRIPFVPSIRSHRNLSPCSIRDSSTGETTLPGVSTEQRSKARPRSAGRPWWLYEW